VQKIVIEIVTEIGTEQTRLFQYVTASTMPTLVVEIVIDFSELEIVNIAEPLQNRQHAQNP